MIKPTHITTTLKQIIKSGSVRSLTLIGFLYLAAVTNVLAQASPKTLGGEELFAACAFCHGSQGQGRQRLDAPPIAGLQAWYVERQLHNFDNEVRGAHVEDLPGAQMIVISGIFRDDQSIKNVSAYVEGLEPGAPPVTRGRGENARPEPIERPFTWESEYAFLDAPNSGDVANGQKIYSSSCIACHGANAAGIEAMSSPNLTVLASWYMARQLEYFQDGIRGAHPQDTYGAQMVPFAKMLVTDQAIADVIAYIETL